MTIEDRQKEAIESTRGKGFWQKDEATQLQQFSTALADPDIMNLEVSKGEIHNGLHCKRCFKTIDLTTLDKDHVEIEYVGEHEDALESKNKYTFNRKDPYHFTLWCPHCAFCTLYRDDEVKPLQSFKDVADGLDKRMDKIEKHMKSEEFRGAIAKEIMRQAQREAEEEAVLEQQRSLEKGRPGTA